MQYRVATMSYMMSIKRTISKADFMQVIEGDSEFSVMADGRAFTVLRWSNGKEHAVFNYAQGEISVGSPSDAVLAKMHALSKALQADLVGEEDDLPAAGAGGSVSVTWIGWPIMVVTLLILLIWRW